MALGLGALSELPIATLRDADQDAEYFIEVDSDVVWIIEATVYQPTVEE